MTAPDPDDPTTAGGNSAEVEELKAEVDALRQQVEQGPPSRHRLRKITAVFLVVVFALSTPSAPATATTRTLTAHALAVV